MNGIVATPPPIVGGTSHTRQPHNLAHGFFRRGWICEIEGQERAPVVVAGKDDGVWGDELHAVVGFFVAQEEQIHAPAFDEVFEAFGVVASAPGHEVCAAGSGLVVVVVEIAAEDACIEAAHGCGGRNTVGTENCAAVGVDFEGDGHALDEVVARGFHGGGVVAKNKVNGVVVDIDAADAVFEDACVHKLREFVIAEECVDVLGVAGFEVSHAREGAVAHVHAVDEAI